MVKNADGTAALWFGEIDDLWRMGEPRGYGGPWKDTQVDPNVPSDPYIMIGYNRKELALQSTEPATITMQVDFFADGDWADYKTFDLAANGKVTYLFPEGFHAHWVRFKSSATTTATAQFTYGPVVASQLQWISMNCAPWFFENLTDDFVFRVESISSYLIIW